MAITRRTDYAVRLMYELAQLPTGASLSLRDVCDAADIPASFGQSLMAFLIEGGLVRVAGSSESQLSLARPARQMSMAEIIRACEPEFSLAQCVREPNTCPRSSSCGAHTMWSQLDKVIWDHLHSVTLEDMVSGALAAPDGCERELPRPSSDRSDATATDGS